MLYRNIIRYNQLWEAGLFRKPIVILIGGYCGTGKSTLAAKIGTNFNFINILPTGIIRSTLQYSIKKAINPALHEHTYNLHKVGHPTSNIKDRVIANYIRQTEPVSEAIKNIIRFTASEGQSYIIEGNHVLAGGEKVVDENVIVIEFYMKVTDIDVHRRMIGGPTHQRQITSEQFEVGRMIQDYIIEQADVYNHSIFEYNEAIEHVLEIIDNRLKEEIEGYFTALEEVDHLISLLIQHQS